MTELLSEYDAYKHLQSLFGEDNMTHPKTVSEVDTIPTGSPWIDFALRVGGWPRGRLIHLAGKPGAGKTALSMLAIAQWQAMDPENCGAFLDAEFTYDPVWGESLGIDNDRLFYVKTNEAQTIFTGLVGKSKKNKNTGKVTKIPGLFDLIKAGQVVEMPNPYGEKIKMNLGKMGVIVLDSIATLNTPTDIESEVGKQNMALLARFLSVELKKLTPGIADSNVVFFGINQVRADLSSVMGYGNPESSPGGKALAHACSVMAEVRPMFGADNQVTDDHGDVLGRRVKIKVTKNKVGPPIGDGEYWIKFTEGIFNIEEQILEAGQRCGYIERPTSRSYLIDGKKHTSKDKALGAISKDVEKHIEALRIFYLNNRGTSDNDSTDNADVEIKNPFEDDGGE